MRKSVPFLISIWTYTNIWKTIDDIDGKGITIWGDNALQTTRDFEGTIIDIKFIMLQLGGRMDRLSVAKQSTLMENDDDGTNMRINDCTSGAHRDTNQFIIIYTTDVDQMISFTDDMGIGTSETTIGTAVNKCTV